MRRLFTGILLALALAGCQREPARIQGIPERVLWAWESPQDLRFLQAGEGVAFLGGELYLEGITHRWLPRRNPLRVNPGTPLIAVLRIESRAAALTSDQTEALVSRAAGLLTLPGVRGLQIDFDARDSERSFYAEALRRLRARLPQGVPLSITALASWCLDDGWLTEAHLEGVVDEAVPMLFRMGAEGPRIRSRLSHDGRFHERLARASYGVSTDEPLASLKPGRRCYVFHPGSWTQAVWERVSRELP